MRGGVRPRVPSEGGIHRRGLPGLFPQQVAAATWGLGTGGRVGDGAPCCPVETPPDVPLEPDGAGKCPRAQCSVRLTHRPSNTPSPCPSWARPARVLPQGDSSAPGAPSIVRAEPGRGFSSETPEARSWPSPVPREGAAGGLRQQVPPLRFPPPSPAGPCSLLPAEGLSTLLRPGDRRASRRR